MKKYWFKRKRYGYGWVPTTLQGWLVILTYLVVIGITTALYLFSLDDTNDPDTMSVLYFLLAVGVEITLLIGITIKFAPPGKWRWGKREDDDPQLDW